MISVPSARSQQTSVPTVQESDQSGKAVSTALLLDRSAFDSLQLLGPGLLHVLLEVVQNLTTEQ